ncbi:MAG TPA: MarR family transcriptional regulator [Solirubrobacteraceae bacterium]|nr:MarR family transcriptional regulator [Solirubrobacteraceae bacterium]
MGAVTTSRSSAVPSGPTSPAQEAWALLRTLLFAERRRFLGAASEFDLHPAQAGALMQLDDDEGLPMHEIASHLACDSSNVTGIVDRLESRGLVSRRTSNRDRRVKQVVATPLGVEVRDALRARMAHVPEGLERLSPRDQRLLRDLLDRVLRDG